MELKRLNVPFELKEVSEDEEYFTFKGYASVFDYEDLVGDIVEKGAFVKSLIKRMPIALWQHRSDEPIGVYTLATENDKGLYVEGKLPKSDTLVSGRIMPQMKAGSVKAMSIGYNTVVSEWNDEKEIRYLKELELWEISLVTFPANDKATVDSIKSLEESENITDVSKYLKEKGLSKKETDTVVFKIKELASKDKKTSTEKELIKSACNELSSACNEYKYKNILNELDKFKEEMKCLKN